MNCELENGGGCQGSKKCIVVYYNVWAILSEVNCTRLIKSARVRRNTFFKANRGGNR